MKVYGDRGLVVTTTLEDTRMLSERGREKLMVFVRIGGKKKRGKKKYKTVRKLKSNGMVSVVHESYFKVKVRLKKNISGKNG